jgi:hypothetical protein
MCEIRDIDMSDRSRYLTPWRDSMMGNEKTLAIFKLGEKKPFIHILGAFGHARTYSTIGLRNNGLNHNLHTSEDFTFNSFEHAKQTVESILLQNGFTILTEEQASKLEVLI